MNEDSRCVIYEVYIAGYDKMELYKRFQSEEKAIDVAKNLSKHNIGSISVYKVEKIFSC